MAEIQDFIKSPQSADFYPEIDAVEKLLFEAIIMKSQKKPRQSRLTSIFDARKFQLIYDPRKPDQILDSGLVQKMAVMQLQDVGRQILRRWHNGISERVLTGAHLRELLEIDRKIHFPRIKRPMMRAFQDAMVMFGRLGLVKKVPVPAPQKIKVERPPSGKKEKGW